MKVSYVHISEAIVSEIYDKYVAGEKNTPKYKHLHTPKSHTHKQIFIYLFIHEQISELQRLDISVNIQSIPMNNYERFWCRTTNTENI